MKKKCKVVALATNDNKNFALVKRDFDWVVHEKEGIREVEGGRGEEEKERV